MIELNNYFFNDSTKKFLIKWINGDYKKFPLCIYGGNGVGKTSLANYLVKAFSIIKIDIEFIKTTRNFKEYLDLSLGKKNICMMFCKKEINNYKAIVFDDLQIIQSEDKTLFKSISSWSKNIKNYSNHPIIFIFTNNCFQKKSFKEIVSVCKCIEIKYNDNQFNKLVQKIIKNEKLFISLNHIQQLIKKSGKNINNIYANIDFIKNDKKNSITTISENDFSGDLNSITLKILNDKFNINNILSNSYNDYNIISLNLLDNLPKFFKKNYLQNYLHIYKNVCLGDRMNSDMIVEHNYELMEYILIQQIVLPIYNIKVNYLNMIKELQYNKYISKSIYYINNYNICIKNDLNICDIYFELFLYDYNINKEKYIDKKILEKYVKIYNWIFNRNFLKKNLIQ